MTVTVTSSPDRSIREKAASGTARIAWVLVMSGW